MIRLFIEKQEVILPDDFEFTYINANPMLTRSGDFTLDLTISLEESRNSIAFGHIERLNSNQLPQSFSAQLIINSRVQYGKAIVMENSSSEVTLQFVAGNSELAYTTNNEGKIWALDWGSIPAMNPDIAYNSLLTVGYVRNQNTFVCTPIISDDVTINDFRLEDQNSNYAINHTIFDVNEHFPETEYYTLVDAIRKIEFDDRKLQFKIKFKSDKNTTENYIFNPPDPTVSTDWFDLNNWITIPEKYIMQPYLLFYIEKLVELLGYKLNQNTLLNDSRARKMYLLNTIESLNYADALPDITISEFIDSVELFFNVRFVVNSYDKTADILHTGVAMEQKRTITVTQVLDEYTRKYETNGIEDNSLLYTRITYPEIPGTWGKYQQLSDDVLTQSEIRQMANLDAIIAFLQANPDDLGNRKIIYHDSETGNQYFVTKYDSEPQPSSIFYSISVNRYVLRLINKFRNNGGEDKNTITFNIVPAEMNTQSISLIYSRAGTGIGHTTIIYQLPKSSNSYFFPEDEGFVEMIENENSIPRTSHLEVSLYTGIIKMNIDRINTIPSYPYSHIDILPESYGTGSALNWLEESYKPAATKGLTIFRDIQTDYYKPSKIDSDKVYSFTFEDLPDIDIDHIFIIRNQKYIPISFEYQVNNRITNKIVSGDFYRMKE